jgi:rhodanese-related sulfurtransferase
MDSTELQRRIEAGDESLFVVDVRTPEEYATGHIPTAGNISHIEISLKPPTKDVNATIVLYCESGSRSGFAKTVLGMRGYRNVINFGGIADWDGEIEL